MHPRRHVAILGPDPAVAAAAAAVVAAAAATKLALICDLTLALTVRVVVVAVLIMRARGCVCVPPPPGAVSLPRTVPAAGTNLIISSVILAPAYPWRRPRPADREVRGRYAPLALLRRDFAYEVRKLVQVSKFRAQDLGFRIKGLGFRV
jgi:hypothetical protein